MIDGEGSRRRENASTGVEGRSAAPDSSPPHTLIRASAGSGKTFQLSNRYLALLRHSGSPERILAVTFTRKAAAEILERILLRLAEATTDDLKRSELGQFLGGPPLRRADCEAMLVTLTRHLHRVRVGTLDSFFSRLGSTFAMEVGLPADWSIADEAANRDLTSRAVDAVLRQDEDGALRRLLRLLAQGDLPRSVNSLISNVVDRFYDVFQLTGEAAWRKLRPPLPRSAEEVARLSAALAGYTFSKGKSLANARDKDIGKIAAGDWIGFLTKGPASALLNRRMKYGTSTLPDDLVALYRPLLEHARAILLTIWSDQNVATYELLSRFHAARGRLMRESGGVRFGDVAAALGRRLSLVDARRVVHRLDAGIDHLLLDEFQDTSLTQWQVLDPFVKEIVSRDDGSLFCVGDAKQAIYGWRGGVAALFEKVADETPGLMQEELHHSRRSSPVIIDAVNRVFQNLALHPNLGSIQSEVAEWSLNFPLHDTVKSALPGHVTLETTALEHGDSEDHQRSCSAAAADLVMQIVTHAPQASIGVLARKNSFVARIMYDLGQRGVPASEEGGVPLTNSAAVQLVQSMLRFADHPGDSAARFHLAGTPLAALYGLDFQMSAAAAHFAALRIRQDLATRGYEAMLEVWANQLRPLCCSREWRRLRRLCAFASQGAARATLRPAEFADRIEREKVEDPSSSHVRVMTVHKSKGLEFDVVVLPDLDIRLHDTPPFCACGPGPAELPDTVLLYRNEKLHDLLPPELQRPFEEERRRDVHESLCNLYVSMTRARQALHLIVKPQLAAPSGQMTLPASFGGLLRATLAGGLPAAPATVLFEAGNPRWWDSPSAESARSNEATPALELTTGPAVPAPIVESPQIRLASRDDGPRRGREMRAPSQHAERISGRQLLSLDRSSAVDRGTLWHFWCQQLGWLDESSVDEERLLAEAMPMCPSARQLRNECRLFLEAINQPAIRRRLSKSHYRNLDNFGLSELAEATAEPLAVQLFQERGFTVIDESRHLSGSIDRLVLMTSHARAQAAEIIDFKTDALGERTPRRSLYEDQLRLYTMAVQKSQRLDPLRIKATLIWLATGVVETVAASPG